MFGTYFPLMNIFVIIGGPVHCSSLHKLKEIRVTILSKSAYLHHRNVITFVGLPNGKGDFLGVKEVTLALWKSNKRYDIPVVKVGRLAKYRYSDLLEFVERRTVNRPANDNKDVH